MHKYGCHRYQKPGACNAPICPLEEAWDSSTKKYAATAGCIGASTAEKSKEGI